MPHTPGLLNYHHLYYFFVIAREGSISRASQILHLSQPGLSQQLRALELSLGLGLFDRDGRSLRLTDSGRLVYRHAEKIFAAGEDLLEALRSRNAVDKAHLRLGSSDSVPKRTAQQLLEGARLRGAGLVTLSEGSPEALFADLAEGRCDLVLSHAAPSGEAARRLESRLLSSETVGVWGAARFLMHRAGFPTSLDGAPIILPSQQPRVTAALQDWLGQHGAHCRTVAETQDTEVLVLLALSGHGVIPATRAAVPPHAEGNALFLLGTVPGLREEIWISHVKDAPQGTPAQRTFSEFSIVPYASSDTSKTSMDAIDFP